MLLHDFSKWTNENTDQKDQFGRFFQDYALDHSPYEIMEKLAYQIYELQSCVEYMIQDLEEGYEA